MSGVLSAKVHKRQTQGQESFVLGARDRFATHGQEHIRQRETQHPNRESASHTQREREKEKETERDRETESTRQSERARDLVHQSFGFIPVSVFILADFDVGHSVRAHQFRRAHVCPQTG